MQLLRTHAVHSVFWCCLQRCPLPLSSPPPRLLLCPCRTLLAGCSCLTAPAISIMTPKTPSWVSTLWVGLLSVLLNSLCGWGGWGGGGGGAPPLQGCHSRHALLLRTQVDTQGVMYNEFVDKDGHLQTVQVGNIGDLRTIPVGALGVPRVQAGSCEAGSRCHVAHAWVHPSVSGAAQGAPSSVASRPRPTLSALGSPPG